MSDPVAAAGRALGRELRDLGGLGLARRLPAVGDEPPLVVMEDLGSAPGVADLLLGNDSAAADEALVAWRTRARRPARSHPPRTRRHAPRLGFETRHAVPRKLGSASTLLNLSA